VFVTLPTI
jgi:hypothetical protein